MEKESVEMVKGEVENMEQPRSHLFLVRVWQEQLDGDRTEWRGKIHHVMTGQELYFREWEGLVQALGSLLGEKHSEEQETPVINDGYDKSGRRIRDGGFNSEP